MTRGANNHPEGDPGRGSKRAARIAVCGLRVQLLAFVSLAAKYIHKASAESKDTEEKLEASLRRIEERLGTLPPSAPPQSWELPETSLEMQDRAQ